MAATLNMVHLGGCHCGNLRYALETKLALTALPLRAGHRRKESCRSGFSRDRRG